MKTQTDIVLETLQFYLEDPSRRADSGVGCFYRIHGEVPRHCALGRCMTDEALEKLQNNGFSASTLATVYGPLDQFLKPEYHGHPTKFWRDLQSLHDKAHHWSLEGRQFRRHFVAERFPNASPKALELGLI